MDAKEILANIVSPAKLCELFDSLPLEPETKGSGAGRSFFSGLCSRVKTGLRANTNLFPESTKAFNTYVRSISPEHRWTSIALFENVQTELRRDALNSSWPNLVVPIIDFKDGSVWVEWPAHTPTDPTLAYEVRELDGAMVLGALLPVADGPIKFGAKQLRRETQEFSGRRLVLVAYSLQALGNASNEDIKNLEELGCQVPQSDEQPASPVPAALKSTSGSDKPVIIEVFAGSAGITRAARDAGFNAIAVDWSKNKHESKATALNIDLSSEVGEKMLFSLLEEKKPKAIHVSPPCGTASLARERPMPTHLLRQGAPSPKPLRSPEWIWGLPRLTGFDKDRVETANRLCRFTARLMLLCLQFGCLISIENPAGSYFWACLVDCIRTLGAVACSLYNTLEHVVFSSCLHGGSREKSTKWLSSPGVFSSLAGECPGESATHKHLPYGVHRANKRWRFDTASEGAYPDLLCLRVVHSVAAALGFSPVPSPRVADPISQSRKSRRLLPEYACITSCDPRELPSVP